MVMGLGIPGILSSDVWAYATRELTKAGLIVIPLSPGQVYQATYVGRTDPGTAYIEFSVNYRKKIPFSRTPAKAVAFMAVLCHTEAGAGAGLKAYNITDATDLAEIVDFGTTTDVYLSPWNTSPPTADKSISMYVKGISTTDDVYVYEAWLLIVV